MVNLLATYSKRQLSLFIAYWIALIASCRRRKGNLLRRLFCYLFSPDITTSHLSLGGTQKSGLPIDKKFSQAAPRLQGASWWSSHLPGFMHSCESVNAGCLHSYEKYIDYFTIGPFHQYTQEVGLTGLC